MKIKTLQDLKKIFIDDDPWVAVYDKKFGGLIYCGKFSTLRDWYLNKRLISVEVNRSFISAVIKYF